MNSSEKKELIHDLLYHSLIGKEVEIINSKNKRQVGIKGIIVYETANFFHIEKKAHIVKILKENIELRLIHKGKALNMDGRLLTGTVTYRIKKLR
jgi:RNase P/RNase MRP subunit p29